MTDEQKEQLQDIDENAGQQEVESFEEDKSVQDMTEDFAEDEPAVNDTEKIEEISEVSCEPIDTDEQETEELPEESDIAEEDESDEQAPDVEEETQNPEDTDEPDEQVEPQQTENDSEEEQDPQSDADEQQETVEAQDESETQETDESENPQEADIQSEITEEDEDDDDEDDEPEEQCPEDFEVTVESVIEAVLFASDEALTAGRLAKISETSTKQVRESIKALNKKYRTNGNVFRIEKIAGGFQMLTLSPYNNWLRKLVRVRDDSKLSPAALETLAIIAYKQPIIRADVESIRGVAAGEMIRSLMYKGLVKITGRAEVLGRPLMYGTTKKFLDSFALNSLKDLPKIEELKKPAN